VHRYGRTVLHRAGEVVDVDHVPENRAGVPVGGGHRGAGEGEQGGVRQRVLQVPGVPVQVVVVGPVRLVHEQDDVRAFGEHRVGRAGLPLGGGQAELLQRG